MRAPRLPVVLLGLSLATTQAAAAPVDTAGATQCEARGFSIDPDPKGTNVRSAPRADAPIIGHLAPRVRVTPVEYHGRRRSRSSAQGRLAADPRTASPPTSFTLDAANAADGRGWVSGKLVGTTLAAVSLRTAPRWDAPASPTSPCPARRRKAWSSRPSMAAAASTLEVTGTPLGGKTVRGWSYCALLPASSRRAIRRHRRANLRE